MLRRWNEAVLLRVARGGVQARWQRHWPRRATLACAGCPAAGDAWPQALDSVLGELEAHAPLRGMKLDIEVGDAFAHFDVAGGEFDTSDDARLDLVAGACARELLGEAADAAALRWQLQPGGHHLAWCALQRQLLEQLDDALEPRGAVVRSILPCFARRWNQHCKALGAGMGVFASLGDGHAVLACAHSGTLLGMCADTLPPPLGAAEDNVARQRLGAQMRRLLAGLDIALEQVERFVAVGEADALRALSNRWTALADEGDDGDQAGGKS